MQATPLSAAALHRPPLVLLCCIVGVGVTLRVGLLLSWFSEMSKESSSKGNASALASQKAT